MKLIDKSAVVAKLERLISNGQTKLKESEECKDYESYVALAERIATCINLLSFLDTLEVKEMEEVNFEREQGHSEPYFYCKYGGTMPLCSDCKRNHNNSSFKTEEIATWYAPSNGTKQCIDYIQQGQSEMDLKKEVEAYRDTFYWDEDLYKFAKHFYELGLKTKV